MRTKNTVLLVAGLCVIAVGMGIIGPATAGDSNGENSSITGARDDVEIDSAIANAEGETTVIVQFEERPDNEIMTTAAGNQVASMQSHAAETQTSFEQFAEGSPHVEIKQQFWITNAMVVTVNTEKIPVKQLGMVDHVTELHDDFEVEAAKSDAPTGVSTVPTADDGTVSSSSSTYTYGLKDIRVPETWDSFGNRGNGVTVAVLDTGVDADHPDINVAGWKDFDSSPSSEPKDYGDHGTHVSGTVAGGNTSGTAIGVAPEAELLHGAVLTNCADGCYGRYSQIVSGMEWAVRNDADVISMSLGSEGHSDYYIDPVRNAERAGTLVVSSSGNDGAGTSGSPGNVYEAFSIGAADQWDRIASFSSGERIDTSVDWDNPPYDWPSTYTVPDVAAPGSWVESAKPGGGYQSMSGTSMAAPHVSGSVALLLSNTDEHLSPAEIRDQFESTAVDIGESEDRQGAGRIDVFEAVLTHSRETFDPTIAPETANVSEPTTISVTADHPIEEYRWEFADGTTTTTTEPTVEHTFEEPGSTPVTVTLVDPSGETTTTTTELNVVDEVPPTAELEANRTRDVEVRTDTVELDATGSTDNYEIDRYEWKIDDERNRTTNDPLTEFMFETPGNKTVSLTIIDETGNENTTTVDIEVVDTTAPVPSFESPTQSIVETEATFNATRSTDNHEIDHYEWSFGNESSVTTESPSSTYEFEEVGNHTVSLTVTDPSGNVNETNDTVEVRPSPSVTIDDPSDGTATNISNVTVEYTLADTDLENASGLQYRIQDADDGSSSNWTGGPFERAESPQQFAVHTGELSDGPYTISVRLVDDRGAVLPFETATDDRTITVKASEPELAVNIQPTNEQYPDVSQRNPAIINVTATDQQHESTVLTVTESGNEVVNEWDLSTRTGSGGVATVEWPAIDDSDTPVESGDYEISATTVDALGNANTSSTTIGVDTEKPDISVDSINGTTEHDGDVYLDSSTNLTLTVTADDGRSDPDVIDDVSISLEAAFTNYRHELTVERDTENTWRASVAGSELPDEGTYHVRASVTDSANNTNETVAYASVISDRTSPDLSAVISDLERDTATVSVRSTEALADSPAISVISPDGNETVVENITERSDTENGWMGSFEIDDIGSYGLTASGVDLAGNRGSDTANATIPDGTTDDRTLTAINERTGTFVTLNTTEDVDNSSVTLSETTTPPGRLETDTIGITFLTTALGDGLERNLSNATIGVPVERLPDTVSDDDSVKLQRYNQTENRWERRNLTVREFENATGDPIDGEYWVATVDELYTYGITVVDGTQPELVDVTPADGTTLEPDAGPVPIKLEYEDTLTGVNASSIELSIDGERVTDDERTQFTSQTAVHEGLTAEPGETVEIALEIADKAGNAAVIETDFDIAEENEDDDGGSGSGGGFSFSRSDNSGPPAPTASIAIDSDLVTVGEEITFSGADSNAEDRSIIAYEWTIDGETYEGETVTTVFDEPGTYDVELVVSIGIAESDPVTASVTVQDRNDNQSEPKEPIEEEQSTTDTDGDDGLSGFGSMVALIALLSVAFFSLRR